MILKPATQVMNSIVLDAHDSPKEALCFWWSTWQTFL